MHNRQNLYVPYKRTVISIVRLQMLDILVGGIDVFYTLPRVGRFVCTDCHSIPEKVSLMHAQAEAVNTVASEWGSEMIAVFTGSIQ